jgi:hypothetical protein
MTYCLHACQIRLRSLNGLNLGSLTARPRRGHSLGAEAAEIAADKAEKSSRVPGIERLYESSSESNDSEVMVPATPPRPVGQDPARRGVSGGHHYNPGFEDPGTVTPRARSYP